MFLRPVAARPRRVFRTTTGQRNSRKMHAGRRIPIIGATHGNPRRPAQHAPGNRHSTNRRCPRKSPGMRLRRAGLQPASFPPASQGLGEVGEGYALLAVADNGPGVPAAEKERIFEKFHQVTGGQKVSKPGVGLGLAVSRTIVDAHDGAIWVEDNPGGGSIFYVLLAAGSVREAASVSTSSPL